MSQENNSRLVADGLHREIEHFLFHEARLLDERRFHEWIEFFTEDARYWMPVRADRSENAPALDFAKENELAFFDETKETLKQRAQKLDTGMAWAEEPRSRTRHLVTNVEAYETDDRAQIKVFCNFIVYRTRLETKEDLFVGRREDLLRKEKDSWKIAGRKIFLDQTVLFADNLSIFF
jgi:3-phenylpropionate/cinnamic acid dioxygenase small subunit